jgi:hypothetical protein
MGGQTFGGTQKLDTVKYIQFFNSLKEFGLVEPSDFICPLRLGNKNTFGDIDLVVNDTDKIIDYLQQTNQIKEIKIIPLFEERFGLSSKHVLTTDNIQIDLLKSWNLESIEITRAYYSYSFANIFLKRLTDIVDRNLKFSYLGLFCSSNKFVIPNNVKYIQVDASTRMIIDCNYIFELLDLDYNLYTSGFADEKELLEYFSKSKYFNEIKFKFNSKFKHDYSRLKPFANLVDQGLIQVENFIKNI